MKGKKYAMLWVDMYHDITIGSPSAVAKAYCEAVGAEVRLSRYKDDIACIYRESNNGGGWGIIGEIEDTGSDEENMARAYELCFEEVLGIEDDVALYLCEITSADQEKAFTLDLDDILDQITAREVRDEDLDVDDEAAIRLYYYRACSR